MSKKKVFLEYIKKKCENKLAKNEQADIYTREFLNRNQVNQNVNELIFNAFNNVSLADKILIYYNTCKNKLSLSKIDSITSKIIDSLKLTNINLANELIETYYEPYANVEKNVNKLAEILTKYHDDVTVKKTFELMKNDLLNDIKDSIDMMSPTDKFNLASSEIERLENNNYNLDRIIPEIKEENNYLDLETTDEHPFEDTINELIEANQDDEEYIKALNIANHATQKGKEKYVNYQTLVA